MSIPFPAYNEPVGPDRGNLYYRPTELSEEVDALTGYDRAAMFEGFDAAVRLRAQAKQKIGQLQSRIAGLAARFETHGTMPSQAEHERTQLLAEIMEEVRQRYYSNPDTEKVPPKRAGEEPTTKIIQLTQGEVEARAKADPRYKVRLEGDARQREQHALLKAELSKAWAEYEEYKESGELIRLQLEDRKSLIYYASNAPHRRQPHQP